MSILRTSCRCTALATRLVRTHAVQQSQVRALSVSAVAQAAPVLPSTNWGAMAPPKRAARDDGPSGGSGGNDRQRPPRNRGRGDGGEGFDGGNRQRNRGGNRDRQGDRGDRNGGSGFGLSRGGDRGGDRGGERGGQRRDARSQGGRERGGNDGFFRRDNQQSEGRKPVLPATSWGRPPSSGPSRAQPADDSMPARGKGKAAEVVEDIEPAFDVGDNADAEFEDRHGRKKRAAADSRSLLHSRDGDLELPSVHHRSTRKADKKAEKGKGGRFNKRDWILDEEADEELREQESLKKLQEEKAARARAKAAEKAKAARAAIEKDVYIPANISVSQLAEKFGVKLVRLQRKMVELGMEEDMRRADYLLNSDDASNLALEYNMNPIIDSERGYDIYPEPEEDPSACPLRPPVVTIMGHVDHGKTTLLDALRHTSVAAGEAGGITQHIGAFSVPLSSLMKDVADSDATITFLDTPGHAAFTGMRARGASVTDLVVLVVAADDGVMPQTKEVINLVQKEGDNVGLVVAINKCDKPQIDVDRVKSGLGSEGIILEEDGGDVPSVRVSGLAKLGLDDLVETLATLAEVRDLRARTEGKAEGWVLESNVDKGLGTVATVLVTRGTLRPGCNIVAGTTWAHIRKMTDSTGKPVDEAGPGTPVSVTGWRDVPTAGDQLLEAPSEAKAKMCIDNRLRDLERKALAADAEVINIRRQEDRLRLEAERAEMAVAKESGLNVQQALYTARKAAEEASSSGRKELRLIIKADVSGTVEAVVGSLSAIGNKEAGVKIVHTGVGEVSESDIMLGDAAEGTVIGFNVECPRAIQSAASDAGVPVVVDSVIYRLIENVRGRVAALLPPRIETRVTGEATVHQIFPLKSGRKLIKNIAGCKVMNGTISKMEKVRVLRNREVVFEGNMDTLKHMKKDVAEMRKGTECGIALEGFDDVQEGDQIVTFQTFEVARELN